MKSASSKVGSHCPKEPRMVLSAAADTTSPAVVDVASWPVDVVVVLVMVVLVVVLLVQEVRVGAASRKMAGLESRCSYSPQNNALAVSEWSLVPGALFDPPCSLESIAPLDLESRVLQGLFHLLLVR